MPHTCRTHVDALALNCTLEGGGNGHFNIGMAFAAGDFFFLAIGLMTTSADHGHIAVVKRLLVGKQPARMLCRPACRLAARFFARREKLGSGWCSSTNRTMGC